MIVESLGFDIPEAELLIADTNAKPVQDPADDIPETELEATSREGDLWLLGKHRLLCGSSLVSECWSRLMQDAAAQTAFVDPPYNVPVAGHVSGLRKVKHSEFAMASGEMSPEQFVRFNVDWFDAMLPHLADGAVIAVCMDWRHDVELQTAARQAGLDQLNLCIWNKTNGSMGSLYRSKHELVFIYKKGRAAHINNVQLGTYGRYRTNVWDFAGANAFGAARDKDLADHPTVKPVALVTEFLRDVSHHGHIALDAFMGSGTTLLAAERSGRVAYDIEIEPKFVDVAIRRWQAMTGQAATLADDGRTFAEIAAAREEASRSSLPEADHG